MNRPLTLEQRLARLEQLVLLQAQTIEELQKTLREHDEQLDQLYDYWARLDNGRL